MSNRDKRNYWRGYVDGAEDARNRRGTTTGPNAAFGNLDYDLGYSHGWTAEGLRLGHESMDVQVETRAAEDEREFGPCEQESHELRWRFPDMMNVRTFGTVTVTALSPGAAYAIVRSLVSEGEACRKRNDGR